MKAARIIRAIAAGAATAVLVAACTSTPNTTATQSKGPYTLRVNFGGFPTDWTPGAGKGEPGYMRVPYETLVTLDGGQIRGVLATDWSQTDQSLTLTLRQGVVFHDGTPFDGAAVRTNLENIANLGGQYGSPLKAIRSIDVQDTYTVRLNLREPTPSMLTTLTTLSGLIASPKAWAAHTLSTVPDGTGAWAYDAASSAPGTRMDFKFFDKYWGGRERVGFDTIELYGITDDIESAAHLAGGEVDMTELDPTSLPLLDQTLGIEYMNYPAIRNNLIFFDRGSGGIFSDVRMRQAVCYAVDTHAYTMADDDMIERTQHFSEGEVGYNKDITGYSHDAEKARELYHAAYGTQQVTFSVDAAPFLYNQFKAYADQIHAALGWTVNVVQDFNVPEWLANWREPQFKVGNNSYKNVLGLGSNSELTPYDWYRAWFAPDAPGNPSGAVDAALEAAADDAIKAGSGDAATAAWAKVTKIISDDALTCAHVAGGETIVWNSGRVTNVAPPRQPWEQNLVNFYDLRPVV